LVFIEHTAVTAVVVIMVMMMVVVVVMMMMVAVFSDEMKVHIHKTHEWL